MTIESRSDVVVVSAFGRGNWLAAELASSGLKVSLVETSDHLGRWTPEDWEGPFGYFQTDKLLASQKARLIEEDYTEDLPEGFTVWLSDGPIDLKSALSSHLLSESGISKESLKYLNDYDSLSPEQIRVLKDQIGRGPFSKNWLVQLAHQLASHVYKENAQCLTYGRPLPIFSPWLLRRASRKGVGHSLDWVASRGVKVHNGAEFVDISTENGSINSIEIRSAWSGAMIGRQFVWMLTGEETKKLSPKVSDVLYPKGVLQSSWNWVRFRMRLAKSIYLDNLPLKFVMIGDLFAPWTHSNLLIVQRTVQSEDLDVWIRIPSQHRFQRAYLEAKAEEIVDFLRKRIPACSASVADMPQDYLYEYQELGPPRFPLFLESDLRSLSRAEFSNLQYSSAEDWGLFEWSSLLKDQFKICEKIQKWKKELELKASRENREAKEKSL